MGEPIANILRMAAVKTLKSMNISYIYGQSIQQQQVGVTLDIQQDHVHIDNGIVTVSFSNPQGLITGIKYGALDNVLEYLNYEDNRGYWDLVWNDPEGSEGLFDKIRATKFTVIHQDERIVELSFSRTWDFSSKGQLVPLNIDKRFIVRQGDSGFYSYVIFERPDGWPDFELGEFRLAFKLSKEKFHYMAITDNRQRIMPMPDDRAPTRSETLAYPEAVILTDPTEKNLEGEVDDKYQYSCENQENRVNGWISLDSMVGFWKISPSDEARNGGPLKQDLTSHVGPTTLEMFHSDHYAGSDITPIFRNGETWEKVFGPVFIYLNSGTQGEDTRTLWEDAKRQMRYEASQWPYKFPASPKFTKAENRGTVSGRLSVEERFVKNNVSPASLAYVGLALPGEAGSWQTESKGYQFWNRADVNGNFIIQNILPGDYNLYATVPGIIGDYKNDMIIKVSIGSNINLGNLVFKPPRDGPTIWEIGVPDRTANEFYIPSPNPKYINKLYLNNTDTFRQYGLWERYADIYRYRDLIYTIDVNDYNKDWFFAQVTRKNPNGAYQATTWQIKFQLSRVINDGGIYKLRLALASSNYARLEVRFNNPNIVRPHFSTGRIGRDNAVARHAIHGLYSLFSVDVPGSWLKEGENIIFLTQAVNSGPFSTILYDYLRLEGPPSV